MNAAVRMYGLTYSEFVSLLNGTFRGVPRPIPGTTKVVAPPSANPNALKLNLDRKILAELAVTEPLSFRAVVEVLKEEKQKFLKETNSF